MPSPYDPENFRGRVAFAASYISAGRKTSRAFDSCFEMNDGDAVAVAIFRRAQKRPDTKLARNLWRYLCRESVEETAAKLAHVKDLDRAAAEERAGGEAAVAAAMERMRESA